MNTGNDLEILECLAGRRDHDGRIELESAETLSFYSDAGTRWIRLVDTNPIVVALSDHGRQALGEL